MDSNSAYHQLAYIPYSINTTQAQSQNRQQNHQTAYSSTGHSIYNYSQKPVISVSNATDYSNYNNYLYQSTIAQNQDPYTYYSANENTPTSVYQTYSSNVTPGSSNEQAVNKTWNEILAAYSQDAYATLRAKDLNSIRSNNKTPRSSDTGSIQTNSTLNEKNITLRPKSTIRISEDSISKELKKIRHKSVYGYTTPDLNNFVKEKRLSLIDNLNSTDIEKKILNENDSQRNGQDLTKGSPLFLKIMSKLAELPDLSKKLAASTPPGAPDNSKSASQTQPTTTASTISTDTELRKDILSQCVNNKLNLDTTIDTNNVSFTSMSIKMTDKPIAHGMTNEIGVRGKLNEESEPSCSTPINTGENFLGFEKDEIKNRNRLSLCPANHSDNGTNSCR